MLPPVDEVFVHGVGAIDSIQPSVESTIQSGDPPVAAFPSNPLGDFMTRPAVISSFTIAPGTPTGSLAWELKPIDYFFLNSTIFPKIQNYHLFSGDFEVEVVFTVPSGAYGMGVLMALPQPVGAAVSSFTRLPQTLHNSRQLDISVLVDFSRGGSYKIRLPWRYWYDKSDFSTEGYRAWWRLGFMMLTPLQSSFPGATVAASGRIIVKALPGFDMCVTRKQGKFSTAAGLVSRAAGAFSDFPVIGEAARVASGAAAAVGHVAAYFGYTRENQQVAPSPMFHKALTNVAQCEGSDNGDVAALMAQAYVSSDPTTCWMPDDSHLEFASLFRRISYVAGYAVTPATPTDTNLLVIPVTPFVVDPSEDRLTGVHLSTAGYVGLPFARWRGTINFHVMCVSSTVHSGRIAAFWSPNGNTAADPSDYTSLTNHAWDIADATEHVLCIGHAQANPFLQSDFVSTGSVGQPGINTNGALIIRLLTPFIPQEPSNTIIVYVWTSAGSDLDFRMPRNTFKSTLGDSVALDGLVYLQGTPSNALGAEEPTQPKCVEFVRPGEVYPAEALNYPGQTARSVRALAQKPSEIKTKVAHQVAYEQRTFRQGFLEMQASVREQGFYWDSYYLSMYLGSAASTRFQVVSPYKYSVAFSVGEDNEADYQGGAKSVQNTGDPRGGSFLLPYASPTRFVNWARPSPLMREALDFMTIQPEDPSEELDFPFNIYRSAGPDLRVAMFRQVPLIKWGVPVPQGAVYIRPPP